MGRMTINDMADSINDDVRAGRFFFASCLVKETLPLWTTDRLHLFEEWKPEGYEDEPLLTARDMVLRILEMEAI